jgi:hypothetical protein
LPVPQSSPARDAAATSQLRRQIPPGHPAFEHKQNPGQRGAISHPFAARKSGAPNFGGKQRRDNRPQRIIYQWFGHPQLIEEMGKKVHIILKHALRLPN